MIPHYWVNDPSEKDNNMYWDSRYKLKKISKDYYFPNNWEILLHLILWGLVYLAHDYEMVDISL